MDEVTARIIAFLRGIGIAVEAAALPEGGFLPAMAIRDGMLCVDFDRLTFPGDLLHEAGHIAVTDPERRAALGPVPDDAAEEMAAIAWSYAAAVAIGIDPRVVFHDHGYRRGGGYLADAFEGGGGVGVPLLQWWGMTALPDHAAQLNLPTFPRMARWLR